MFTDAVLSLAGLRCVSDSPYEVRGKIHANSRAYRRDNGAQTVTVVLSVAFGEHSARSARTLFMLPGHTLFCARNVNVRLINALCAVCVT